MMMGLLGLAGLAIDGASWALNKRQVQSAADAAALAGASRLPSGLGAATSMAGSQYGENSATPDNVSVTVTTDQTANDSVQVTATRHVGTFFTSLFGFRTVDVTATAQATIQSFSSASGIGAMPWGVLKATYVPGQPYSIYTKDTANANNGALSLPYVNGANCPDPNGANAYLNEITGALPVCPIHVGETLDTKPGNNSGPTAQGLNQRITDWQTVDQIVQFNADGTATMLEPTSPQLVIIPVLTNPAGSPTWPNGTSAPMTVVGFAWFVITSCGDPSHPSYCANSDGKQVNGVFVTLDSTSETGTPGAYDPGDNTAYTVGLTR
jgi:Flp pilus assembly protein TadG